MWNIVLRTLMPVLVLLVSVPVVRVAAQTAGAQRPMTFLDVQQMRTIGSPSPSPDGKWMLHTLSTMDWKEAKRQTDVHLVSLEQGVASSKQLTFTKEKNETSPRWSADGAYFVFLSNREAPESASSRNQLYLMRPDGGEARRISDAREGVADFEFSKDGRWIVFTSGKAGEQQLYRIDLQSTETPAEQLTKHPTGIGSWTWAPGSKRIYFTSPDKADPDENARREKKFTVDNRNAETRILPLAAERGMAVLTNLPFGRGRVLDAFGARALPDWASRPGTRPTCRRPKS